MMAKEEMAKAELDATEKQFWSTTLKRVREAEQAAQRAAQELAEARTALAGFVEFLKHKYGFENGVELDESGNVVK